MPDDDRRKRRGVAGGASLLVHAVFGALIVWLSRGRPIERTLEVTDPAVTIEVNEVAPAAPAASVAPTAAKPLADARPKPRLPRRPEVAIVRPAPASEAAPPATEASALPDVRGAISDHATLDLTVAALGAETQRRLAKPDPEVALTRKPPGRLSVDERRATIEREEDAVANVTEGRVHPLLYDYLRGARVRFQDEARRLADKIPLGPGATVNSWGRGYLRRVEEVGRPDRNGKPADPAAQGPTEKPPHSDVLAGYNETVRAAESGAENRRAEICLDLAPGRETATVLRRGSGDAAVDRLALDSFANAVAAQPPPADIRSGLACYDLRITVYRMPPVPMLMCGFDLVPPSISCAWPLKRVTSVTGQLISVDYQRGDPARANHSLLRRPR